MLGLLKFQRGERSSANIHTYHIGLCGPYFGGFLHKWPESKRAAAYFTPLTLRAKLSLSYPTPESWNQLPYHSL